MDADVQMMYRLCEGDASDRCERRFGWLEPSIKSGTVSHTQAAFTDLAVTLTLLIEWFVANCLVLVELQDSSDASVTAGLTTARTVCRVIVRDLSGRYCWESSLLYGPPWRTRESSRDS